MAVSGERILTKKVCQCLSGELSFQEKARDALSITLRYHYHHSRSVAYSDGQRIEKTEQVAKPEFSFVTKRFRRMFALCFLGGINIV